MPGDRPDKSHFVVKVLIAWVRGSDKKSTTTVKNQDKRLYGEIIESIPSEVEAELIEKIRLEGASNGQKGYFYAILAQNGQTKRAGCDVIELKINTSQMLPPPTW